MKNSGASFGINFFGLNVLSVVVLILLFLIWRKDRSKGWLLIILGGMINLIERLTVGYVTDYWPIFGTSIYNNINDYLIFVGGIMVIWEKWKHQK